VEDKAFMSQRRPVTFRNRELRRRNKFGGDNDRSNYLLKVGEGREESEAREVMRVEGRSI
jgi:hypothetical protein